MCGGGSSGGKKTATPVNMGYTYSPSDASNATRQKLAAAPNAQAAAGFGSELSGAPSASPATAAPGG